MSEVLSLLTTAALFLIIVIVYRLITKKFFTGLQWIYPCYLLMGYAFTYVLSDQDGYWEMMKSILLYAFIISMIIINVKAIKRGAKARMEHGQRFISDVKQTYQDVKGSFKRKSKRKKEKSETQETQEGDVEHAKNE